MKNKKFTYFLGFAVLLIWGLILYRVFYSVSDDKDEPVIAAKPVREPYNDYTVPKDTTHLLLNYRDPFGLQKQKDTVRLSLNKIHSAAILPAVKPGINWSFIKYSGYIRNPGSKKLIAMVIINGKDAMLSEGETAGNVKLIKNMRDSIKVAFEGKTRFIGIHPVTL
jgi:hypothetical protein